MNGIHDMGGMQDMGAIEYEKNEPMFHAPWEGKVMAMMRAVQATGKYRLGLRPPIESLPPAQYLTMKYYELWLTSLIERLVASDLVTREEIETGKPAQGSPRSTLAIAAADVPGWIAEGAPTRRDASGPPLFKVGEQVRARNINPVTHTRLPRYVRGKSGTIDRVHGVFVFQDTAAYSKGEKPQYVYSVRFAARDLWGEQAAPKDAVYLDLCNDYLEPI
jgi:nitrile hydratase